MAEIHIERKERSVWPWILGLLALALVVWLLLAQRGGREDAFVTDTAIGDTDPGITPGAARTGAVGSFIAYVDERRARAEAGLDHEYTAEGLRRLADALEEIARQHQLGAAQVEQRVNTLRERADALQRNPESREHARLAREAFVAVVDVMRDLQQQRFPDAANQVEQVRLAATSVTADRELLQQKEEVQRFFDRAGEVVQHMAARRSA